MTTVAEPIAVTEAGFPALKTTGAPVETEAPEDELTDAERAWIAKWVAKSPEWSPEKWNRMGQRLGVRFS
ncbi:hypothetical protein [Streptomyces nigrescens]